MMRALTPQQVLDLWADLASVHPLPRTLAVISAAASPDQALALLDLPSGTRERWAMNVRARTFGTRWDGVIECPECRAIHEVEPPIEAILDGAEACTKPVPLRVGDYEVCARVPTSRDQVELLACSSQEDGVHLLLRRCVESVCGKDGPVSVTELSPEVLSDLGDAVAQLDPCAETVLQLTCVQCGAVWDVLFDAGEFLWNEVETHAKRLLRQVHVLARAYGWREAEILSLSPSRREAYLELVGAV